jgi:hypothetical protein
VPPSLNFFDTAAAPPGIYVAFGTGTLDAGVEPFGRDAAGPVFVAPVAASVAVNNLMTAVRRNPPPNEADAFNDVTNARLADITGFLTYGAVCLEIINHTAPGAAAIQAINNSQSSVFIAPQNIDGTSQTRASGVGYVNVLTTALSNYQAGQAIAGPQITAMVDQQYALIAGTPARFVQLAADMNALPLCSAFVRDNAFVPNYLGNNFRFNGAPVAGPDLMAWLSAAGSPAFDHNLRNFGIDAVEHVNFSEFFLLALDILLWRSAPPGAGVSSGIAFNVRREGQNVPPAPGFPNPAFRPPAIALAHELMHAMHYAAGRAPGSEKDNFTTTAAELLFCGIGPFANVLNVPISENTVRGQWGTIPLAAIDASNGWPAPALRTAYDEPIPPDTVQAMRDDAHFI